MSGNLLDGLNPVTQTIESGKTLAKFLGMKEELPETITLANGAWLVLSTKRDCYYYTSEMGCTCKAGTYGRICRHRRDLCEATREAQKAVESRGQTMAEVLEEHDRNLFKMPKSYERMVRQAREQAETEEAPIPESQCSKAVCKPLSEEERAARIAAAKARCEANRQQARDHQERLRALRGNASDSEPVDRLISHGGFKPCLPEAA